MTNKSAKKVVIINDIKSREIEQAILILRDREPERCSASLIEEANEIVQSYIRQTGTEKHRPTWRKRRWWRR